MPDISKESQTTGVTDKQETWKTRNRQNQKRFRDKQKERPTARKLALLYSSAAAEIAVCLPQASRNLLQQEVHDMAERLQQLKAQKQELQSRGIMLERLLKTKHEQAKILQENTYKQVELVWRLPCHLLMLVCTALPVTLWDAPSSRISTNR